ncbi:uncharacterized protein LOC134221805 [Armigeres subalbatus]|uniref:uncharacterized protein LOC134221805 n=1 Tax=Armigeres subalbatus TaxID=124917 RepID=UPI002ED47CE4
MQSYQKFGTFGCPIVSLLFASAVVLHIVGASETDEGRFLFHGKPYLIFPETSPTRHQLIGGIGIPLGSPESITTGYVIKAQYFLPIKVSDYFPNYLVGWNDTRKSLEKREAVTVAPSSEHYEAYTAKDIQIDTEPLPENANDDEDSDEDDYFEDGNDSYWLDEDEDKKYQALEKMLPDSNLKSQMSEGYNADDSRWMTYKSLEHIGQQYGSGGRECVLRSICEAASAQFTHTGGVFAELLHIVFTPSTTSEPLSEHSDNEYLRAEQLGKEGAPCHIVFHECQNSILDVFTGIHDSATNSLTVAHDKVMKAFMK